MNRAFGGSYQVCPSYDNSMAISADRSRAGPRTPRSFAG